MNDNSGNKKQLAENHKQLSELYRGRSTDQLQIKRLWLEIDRLELLVVE
jgi:hypothetical protein